MRNITQSLLFFLLNIWRYFIAVFTHLYIGYLTSKNKFLDLIPDATLGKSREELFPGHGLPTTLTPLGEKVQMDR
jgi:hypothetical protein